MTGWVGSVLLCWVVTRLVAWERHGRLANQAFATGFRKGYVDAVTEN